MLKNIFNIYRHVLHNIWLFVVPILFISLSHQSFGQNVEINLGADEIALNESFKITVTLKDDRLKNYDRFPKITGFVQRGTNTSSSISFVNGKRSSTESITMNYGPTKEGVFTLPPFVIKINGKSYRSPGKKIKVGPKKQRAQRKNPFGADPFDDFFGNRNQSQEFVDVKADAFFALSTNKSEIYQGEGVTVTLAFYVSNKNRADMRFHELGQQITDIVKKIKPENCWEENFNIDNISGETTTINGQSYTQYKIYQAAYFPLNAEDIEFPSVPLNMVKYKVAKNPSFFGRNKKENFQKFYSKAKKVIVKELPDHPLKESVSVGNFRLRENIDRETLKTGESFIYDFDIGGIGNISSITPPVSPARSDFEIYDPSVKQDIKKDGNRISGTKAFQFYGVPNEPGDYDLKDYFSWVFFNTSTEKYDTLFSSLRLKVTGESKKNQYIMANDLGSFYDRIDLEENQLSAIHSIDFFKILMNLLIVVMIALGIAFLVKSIRDKKGVEKV